MLDVNTGSWSRIIPSGDPGSTGGEAYPTPREGAASFSYDRALVGSARNGISDTIVSVVYFIAALCSNIFQIFGGRDTSGHYLSDMWILRSYRDSLTFSGSRWTGYGNGRLQTGPDANGAGVTIKYMTECASPKQAPPSNGDDNSERPTEPQSPKPLPSLDNSLTHKLLSPLSLALLLLTFVLLRAVPSLSFVPPSSPTLMSTLAAALAIGAYAVGIAGFALSFTSLKILYPNKSPSDRTAKHLSTPHSKAAVAFFICLYIAAPLLLLAFAVVSRFRSIAAVDVGSGTTELRRTVSGSTGEKLGGEMTPGTPSINGLYSPGLYSPPASPSPRPRTQSYTMPRRSTEGMSTDGDEPAMSAPPTRGFVVLNRPRGRLSQPPMGDTLRPPSQSFPSSRSLGEIDWLLRRRSLNAVVSADFEMPLATANLR